MITMQCAFEMKSFPYYFFPFCSWPTFHWANTKLDYNYNHKRQIPDLINIPSLVNGNISNIALINWGYLDFFQKLTCYEHKMCLCTLIFMWSFSSELFQFESHAQYTLDEDDISCHILKLTNHDCELCKAIQNTPNLSYILENRWCQSHTISADLP